MENNDESFEAMDVDLSINSSGRMDTTYNYADNTKEDFHIDNVARRDELENREEALPAKITQVPKVKKYHINIRRTQSNVWPKIYLASLFVVSIAIITYNIVNMKCTDFKFSKIKETLSAKVYGQDIAIEQISEALEADYKTKLLILYGGTGVGKTYSISLIMQDMWDAINVYHYTTSSFMKTFTTELCFGMTLCKHSMFIIDDLSTNDLKIKKTVSDIVSKSDKLDKSVVIILIFNCDSVGMEFKKKCDNSFHRVLDLNFSDIKAYKKYVPFQALKKEHLLKCVETELGDHKNYNFDFNNFLKNFEVEQDGCKGVYTKMKLLKI